jgi:hypothetical protein
VKVAAPDESGVPVVQTNEPPRAILGVLFADLAVGCGGMGAARWLVTLIRLPRLCSKHVGAPTRRGGDAPGLVTSAAGDDANDHMINQKLAALAGLQLSQTVEVRYPMVICMT